MRMSITSISALVLPNSFVNPTKISFDDDDKTPGDGHTSKQKRLSAFKKIQSFQRPDPLQPLVLGPFGRRHLEDDLLDILKPLLKHVLLVPPWGIGIRSNRLANIHESLTQLHIARLGVQSVVITLRDGPNAREFQPASRLQMTCRCFSFAAPCVQPERKVAALTRKLG